tara:strand:- start:36 stop:167 length:132 start_codon:yes stop_codon:yes gene_type:complete
LNKIIELNEQQQEEEEEEEEGIILLLLYTHRKENRIESVIVLA